MPILGSDLIAGASDIADMVNDPHVSPTTWLRWANRGITKLCRKLSTLYGGFYLTPANFTLAGGAGGNTSPLPAGCRQVMGVTKDPDNPALRMTLRPRQFDERDEQSRRTFDVIGQNIEIQPFEFAAGTYRLYYIAAPTPLVATTDPMDAQLEAYVEFVETYMAMMALGKEESGNDDQRKDLDAIWEEIEAEAMNRNAAAGEEIVDLDKTGAGWPALVRP